MDHITVGKEYNKGKIALVECKKNCSLENIHIKGVCYMLIILTHGKLEFKLNDSFITAAAPTFVCFDENADPFLKNNTKASYYVIYFHPKFLNINMDFGLLRSKGYEDIASKHDMFMLKPFIDSIHTVPISADQLLKIEHSAKCMLNELNEQRDWYWSCRGRSYFMEIIIALERMFGLMGYEKTLHNPEDISLIKNPKLRDAVLYIEGHYNEEVDLSDIALSIGTNPNTLNRLMKEEFSCTAIKYLAKYRISVSKKHLTFTDVPIKDISNMVGFKTVQHFTRIFKEITGATPAEYRKSMVTKRKDDFNGK